jgi:GNAT superfamily N-acetyltransferase
VADLPPLLIKPIRPLGREWLQLAEAIWTELVTLGLYSPGEVEAMKDAEQHDVSWLPKGHYDAVVSLGGFVGEALVSSVHLWRRDRVTAVIEQLAVDPLHRGHGYARRLVRDAVSAAQREGLETLEVFALEREPKAVEFWRHLLEVAPNVEGHAVFAGKSRPAKGWRLTTSKISV